MPDNPLMPQQQNLPLMPEMNLKLPTTQGTIGTGIGSFDVGSIYRLLSTQQPSLAQSIMPYLQNVLGNIPVQGIRQAGEQQAAIQQSEAMKRGMTGSDIEAAGMLGAREAAVQQENDMRFQVAQSVTQQLMQAMGMDIQSNAQMFQALAQAIGQNLANEQSWKMFAAQMASADTAQKQSAINQLVSSLIGAGGQMGGAALGAYYGPGGAAGAGGAGLTGIAGTGAVGGAKAALGTFTPK